MYAKKHMVSLKRSFTLERIAKLSAQDTSSREGALSHDGRCRNCWPSV